MIKSPMALQAASARANLVGNKYGPFNSREFLVFASAKRRANPNIRAFPVSSSNLAAFRSRVQFSLQRDRIIVQANNSAPRERLPVTEEAGYVSDKLDTQNQGAISSPSMLIVKLIAALGIAAAVTVISVFLKRSNLCWAHQNLFGLGPGTAASTPSSVGFSFSLFGHNIFLPEHPPGWVYFWLLMAAACGLCISEEALNIWVGASLARLLTFDGSWKTFISTFSGNASYIVSTLLWVYWGVCISDMIPFYVGRFAGRSKAAGIVYDKVGINKEKIEQISQTVQQYGNLIGFVERFSFGIRNPTAFLAGAMGISPECFFLGACLGGLITLPIQMAIGFVLRERPVAALAGVATVVGIWTAFPYVAAAIASLVYFIRRRSSA